MVRMMSGRAYPNKGLRDLSVSHGHSAVGEAVTGCHYDRSEKKHTSRDEPLQKFAAE